VPVPDTISNNTIVLTPNITGVDNVNVGYRIYGVDEASNKNVDDVANGGLFDKSNG
jgi:hypothetical protein